MKLSEIILKKLDRALTEGPSSIFRPLRPPPTNGARFHAPDVIPTDGPFKVGDNEIWVPPAPPLELRKVVPDDAYEKRQLRKAREREEREREAAVRRAKASCPTGYAAALECLTTFGGNKLAIGDVNASNRIAHANAGCPPCTEQAFVFALVTLALGLVVGLRILVAIAIKISERRRRRE
ncbi:hypothetical protein PsYK624_169790 [Phanerochaete sordida]|uniref:Uncharacterized protein n=1 Tax=Phanerochaete sordida TaxID=48140 RepID=A0A9P3GTC3_9APHY|nr:hypothetical protein PsYK624_169790 [Phanerochaete sordida]